MKAQHHRFAIWNAVQHPYKHTLGDFTYANPALPGVTNVESALNYILAVLYPQTKAAVATVGDLPSSGNSLNDFRVVQDDGDGNAAGYRWEQREGEVSASWHKIYDMDWGIDSILQQFHTQSQALYVFKQGNDDLDENGAAITGTLAGQQIFGGASANTNLTLSANSGDGTGPQTGFVQFTDHVRPTDDASYDLGTGSEQFRNLFLSTTAAIDTMSISSGSITDTTGAIDFGDEDLTTTGVVTAASLVGDTATIDTLSIATGSITDSTGSIDFGNENLSTTGTLSSGTHTIGTLTLDAASITDSSGEIDFGDEDLTTTGTITGNLVSTGSITMGNIQISDNLIEATNTNGDVGIAADGTGVIDLQSPVTGADADFTGDVTVTGTFTADNVLIDTGSITTTTGNLELLANGSSKIVFYNAVIPATDAALPLGDATHRFTSLFLSSGLNNGTNAITMGEVLSLRNVLFRDAARTQAVQSGDSLFYDAVSGTWLASAPDTEITHSNLDGLTTGDAGHTQFAVLAGRSGGQTLQGGTGSGQSLTLESTSNASKGTVITKDNFVPNATAAYSGGWTGTDLGSSSKKWNDIYTSGEMKGLRLENLSSAPSFSGQNVGRLIFNTTDKLVYVDTGSEVVPVGNVTGNGGSQVTGTATTSAANLTAPAGAIGFILQSSSDNTTNMRWRIGGTASASNGNRLEPGRDTGYIPGAATISIITESSTAEYQIQWITRS